MAFPALWITLMIQQVIIFLAFNNKIILGTSKSLFTNISRNNARRPLDWSTFYEHFKEGKTHIKK